MNNDIGFYFKKINDCLLANANEYLKTIDLTFSQMHILMYIIHSEKPNVLQKDIEQHFSLKHPTVVGLIKRMEKKGLISVEVNPDDRRGNRITALPKAMEISDEVLKGRRQTEELFTRGLDEEQISDLKNLLHIVYENIMTRKEDIR